MSQTSAPLREMVPGRLGLLAEPMQSSVIETKVQPGAKSYFGRMVVADPSTGEEAIKHPDATGFASLGVVAATHAIESQDDGEEPNYPAEDAVTVINKGRVWVAIEEDVAVGDDVYCRHTANGAGKLRLGAFRNDDDTANADQITNARWVKGGTAADGVALLELDIL